MSVLSEKARPGSINFGIGEPSYPTPPSIKKELARLVDEDSAEYGPVAGLRAFREFVAEHYADKGICFDVGAENAVATCGVTEAVYASVKALVERGDEVLYPDPGFVLYRPAIQMCGGTPVPFALDKENGFDFNLELLERQITRKTKVLILNSPSNPTGRVIRRRVLKGIADISEEKGITIVSDEVYEHIVYSGKHRSISEFTDNAVVCGGISKLFRMAGWRLGWCVAKKPLIDEIIKCHQYSVFRAPTIAQRAAPFALNQKREIKRMTAFYRRKRDLMMQRIKKISGIRYAKPEATFFLYADFSGYGDDWKLALRFLDSGVITVPSTGPGMGFGDNGKGFIRLSYALEDNEIREGIRKIKEAL